jgi:cytoskeletal protein RodZ
MSIGSELKHAREREGLSAEHIAERTKVPLYKIEALEEGRFDDLPDDIYLDGIIRAYAREVAVDAEPLIQRSHDERTIGDDWTIDLDELNGVIKKDTAPPSPAAPTFIPPERFKSDDSRVSSRRHKLVLAVVALIAVAGWSAYFYEVTTRGNRPESMPVTSDAVPPSADTASSPDAPMLQDPPATPAAPPSSTAQQAPSASESRTEGTARPARRDAAATAGTTAAATPPPPRAADSPAGAPSAAAAPANTPAPSPTRDVSGAWNFTTNVESTSVEQFSGMRFGYEIELKQAGDQVSGTGRKISENGTSIGTQAQTPISLTGTISGDRLTLTFTEKGAQRDSQGKFVLLADEGTLRGRFSSTAAQSSGTVEAHRAAGAR